jgi:S1-C subfamily serine protease
MSHRLSYLWLLLAVLVSNPVRAEDFPSFERAAASLRAATVTVRVTMPSKAEPDSSAGARPTAVAAESVRLAPRVSVSSGVLVAGGRVVTFVTAPGNARIRITLASGQQAEGRPRVVDRYSGLTLLSTDKADVAGIELAESVPSVGGWVLSAAGWGIEDPVLSFGIVSATDRSLRGTTFPPLLQCDLRTAVSSSGAGLVDRNGRLAGIIVGTDGDGERDGWTYAVDVNHVRRLLRAEREEKVVVLPGPRRPVVGLILGAGPEPEQVVVQRVTPGGPADRAGIKRGDLVLAADGLNIRSVYQAVVPLMKKQPGDTLTLLVEQADGRREIEVTLGGGVELPGPQFAGPIGLVDPRIEVARVGKNRFDLTDARGTVRNLAVDANGPHGTAEQPQVQLLQKALDRYGSLIERYREELQRRDAERAEARELIESLRQEIIDLQREVAKPRQPATGQ